MSLNILYQCDDNYAPYTGVSMSSLFRRNKNIEEINIYILDDGISEENKKKLVTTAEKYRRKIEFIPTEDIVRYIKACGMPKYRGGYTTYLKIFVSNYFTDKNIDIERLIYIDSDTLILGDISDLETIDMGRNIIAMVEDSVAYKFKNKYIGLKEDAPYFNAGFVMFDMKKWIADDMTNRIKDHLINIRSSYANHEQDILNVVLKGRIKRLDPKYNFQPMHAVYTPEQYFRVYKRKNYYTDKELIDAKNDIRIYHTFRYIGIFPWDDNDVHPANKLFDEELRHTEWKDYKKKKKELPLFMKIERALYKVLPRVSFLKVFEIVNYMVNNKANKKSYEVSK